MRSGVAAAPTTEAFRRTLALQGRGSCQRPVAPNSVALGSALLDGGLGERRLRLSHLGPLLYALGGKCGGDTAKESELSDYLQLVNAGSTQLKLEEQSENAVLTKLEP